MTLQAQAKLAVSGSLTLLESGQAFSPYAGSLPVSFRARTLPGSTTILTVQATGGFMPSGGPDLAAGELTFTCGAVSYGSACSGVQALNPNVLRTVVALPPAACMGGGGPCSSSDPASVQVNLLLENSPAVATGTYSVQLLFTFSGL